MELSKLTIEELINYEKAAKIICTKWEKSISNWGLSPYGEKDSEDAMVKEYKRYMSIYNNIIDEIQNRLGRLGNEK